MADGARPYCDHKDSGVPWLGTIPAHWEVRRNGRLFTQCNETGFSDLPILEVSLRTGVRVREFGASQRKQVMSDREKYKRAAKGDVAYNMMRLWQGAVGMAPVDGLVSPAYVVARPYPEVDSRYYAYLFRTDLYMNEVNKYSRGIVVDRNRLYWDEFKQMPSLFPPPDEQRHIANFLDLYGRYVSQFIRTKRRLIDLLNEQKQAIINQAVTRGLDPNVRLKPLGVEWLGELPAHWRVERLKNLCRFTYGDTLPDDLRALGDVPVYGSNGQVGRHSEANSLGPCIVIGRKGSFGKVNYSKSPLFAIDTTFFVDQRHTRHNLRWLYYLLSWARLDAVTKDAAVPGLDRNDAYSQLVPLCPEGEQKAITQWLDQRLRDVDSVIAGTEHEIRLIREYRTRLIADVVAGRLDVRGVETPAEPGHGEEHDPIEEDEVEPHLPADWFPEDSNE